jgi:hypothetical protein
LRAESRAERFLRVSLSGVPRSPSLPPMQTKTSFTSGVSAQATASSAPAVVEPLTAALRARQGSPRFSHSASTSMGQSSSASTP